MVRRHDFFHGSRMAPLWAEKCLAKFGKNRYGENLFRVVFLPSRSTIVGGYWEQDGALEYRTVPRYSYKERKWAVERYVPTCFLGSPDSWDQLSSTLEGYYAIGPYPSHGLFECCSVFSTGFGPEGYVPISPNLVELQARAIWMGRTWTRYQLRAAALGEEEEKIRKADEHFDKLVEQRSPSRRTPTFGAAVNYNKEQQVEDYKLRLIKSRAWAKKHRYAGPAGFSQGEVVN